MPLDMVDSYDPFYGNRYLGSNLKFAFLPKTCDISGKRIWLKYGYELSAMWTGPGDNIFEYRWHDKHEHIIWKLKK